MFLCMYFMLGYARAFLGMRLEHVMYLCSGCCVSCTYVVYVYYVRMLCV